MLYGIGAYPVGRERYLVTKRGRKYSKVMNSAGAQNRQRSGENDMVKKSLIILALMGMLGGCENMSSGQKGAVAGGALGTGIGMVAGGSFGQVVGAGLIGGAVGYVGGSALGK